MSTIDTSPSHNGRGSEAWSRSWTVLHQGGYDAASLLQALET